VAHSDRRVLQVVAADAQAVAVGKDLMSMASAARRSWRWSGGGRRAPGKGAAAESAGVLPPDTPRVKAGYQVGFEVGAMPAQPVPADLQQIMAWLQHKSLLTGGR